MRKLNFSKKLFLRDLLKYFFTANFKNSREWFYEWYTKYAIELGLDVNQENTPPSDLEIDIIIPCLEKDLDSLTNVLKTSLENIKHPIKGVYIISPKSNKIIEFCEQNGYIFIEETIVLGYGKEKINFRINGADRSGWILQQLIKLNADKVCTCSSFLVMDADTVFVKPKIFEYKNKKIIDFADEFHAPYFTTLTLLTNLKSSKEVSFICHYMLFEKEKLVALKKQIENCTGKKWDEAIIDCKDKTGNFSYFSEFETYANFVLSHYPSEYKIEYWFNKSLSYHSDKKAEIKNYTGSNYKSISFHSYSI